MRLNKKKLFIFSFVLLNIYGLLCGVLYFFQESLIFMPTILPQEHVYVMENPYQEIFLDTKDGAKLNGLHFKSENPKGAILYYHGNAGDLQRWGAITSFFIEKGYDVVVMDYRGYGKSRGKKSMEKLYADSELWYAYMKEHYSEKDITLYGRSLGTTFATYVASRNQPKNLILESPFYNIAEVGKSRFPFLPVRSLLHYTFPTNEYITKVSAPISIFHGTNDKVIDFNMGAQLFDTIQIKNKSFIKIPGGGHNDLIGFDEYLDTIDSALEK
ncbi:MAG: alpha-beta hydrolase superfamily lysophospholipase [Psychroserpens sp.]|jgi:alpha-beta hydrolase superfamily lysophospholipase